LSSLERIEDYSLNGVLVFHIGITIRSLKTKYLSEKNNPYRLKVYPLKCDSLVPGKINNYTELTEVSRSNTEKNTTLFESLCIYVYLRETIL